MARELKIVYGTITIDSTTPDRILDTYIKIAKNFQQTIVEFDFIITKTTEAAFAIECSTVEAGFRKPYQDFSLIQGSNNLLIFSQSGNTGMDAMPEISKVGDTIDTGRSRKYHVRLTFNMPADNVATFGLQQSTIDVRFTPARRKIVTISGTFTAVAGSDARAQYNAQIDTYATAILTSLTGTFELAETTSSKNTTNDKLLDFTRVYEEIIFGQVGAGDDADIVRQSLRIARETPRPGDTPDARRLLNVNVSYDCWINKDNTQNLKSKYEDTIKSFILAQVRSTLNAPSIALISERPEFDFDDNRISVTMTILATSNKNILERMITITDDAIWGKVLVPVKKKGKSGKHTKYKYQGPGSFKRTVTDIKKKLGYDQEQAYELNNFNQLISDAGVPYNAPLIEAKNFEHISTRTDSKEIYIGDEQNGIKITETTRIDIFEYFIDSGKPSKTGTGI